MKRKIFTLLLGILVVGGLMAQKPNGEVKMTLTAPVIDGTIDAIWDSANIYNIALPFQTETPTLGDEGETTWKALWDDNGVYILLQVTDDVFSPCYSGCNNWEFDKPELYFDCNYELVDGGGGQAGGNGHRQIAPGYLEANLSGGVQDGGSGITYAHVVTDPNAVWEYFVPWTVLVDKDGNDFIKTNPMGFDVTMIDNDTPGTAGRNRAVWSNDGTGTAANESWNSMDDCGTITFVGAPENVSVTSVAIAADPAAITMDNGTLQINATVLPENASNKNVKWTVVGGASISAEGVLTAKKNGTVTVTATSKDGTAIVSDPLEITISGQFFTAAEANMLVNGDFEAGDVSGNTWPKGWGGWLDGAGHTLDVIGGVAFCDPKQFAEVWHYQLNQSGNDQGWTLYNDTSYVIMFDGWADVPRTINFDFEDNSGNGYTRYGDSGDPNAVGGTSEWNVDLTTEQTTYTQHMTCARLLENSLFKIQFMLSLDSNIVYLDNVVLMTLGDQELVASQVAATGVEITGGNTISVKAGTLQLSAAVTPAEATVASVIWSVDNEAIATIDQNGLLTAVADGNVVVTATAGDHQGATGTVTVAVSNQVGVAELSGRSFRMYPNPVVNVLNVDTKDVNANVAIYNSVGQKVAEMISTNNQARFDVRGLAHGVYFVRVNNGAAEKFVK
ncbi:MAG: Ig-like domain-containing protein [Bacteroidales bacterium]